MDLALTNCSVDTGVSEPPLNSEVGRLSLTRYSVVDFALTWKQTLMPFAQLQAQLDRIPTRNLGRDDRVISCHGKEVRHPFLSLSVVSFVAQLPVHVKLDPRLEAGAGEKMLLRLAAHKLGLVQASKLKKRAMQFGSHSARMTPGGDDRKGDLLLAEPADA